MDLHQLLAERGFSPSRLAKANGIPPLRMKHVLTGESPPNVQEAAALTSALEAPVTVLFPERTLARTFGWSQ